MRVDFLDQMYYGNYRFTVDLDSGSETGCHQLTVWAAEKIDVDNVPLSKFTLEQLFRALSEPHKSPLQGQLEDEKAVCRKPFDEQIEQLKIPFKAAQGKDQRIPIGVKRQIHVLQDQKQKAEKRLAKDFFRKSVFSGTGTPGDITSYGVCLCLVFSIGAKSARSAYSAASRVSRYHSN